VTRVLVLCTANVCRSAMAQALLAVRLRGQDRAVSVCSAGMLAIGEPPPLEVISAVAALGGDIAGHRSRVVNVEDLADADLVLGMAREHIRHAVVLAPGVWSRAFTLRELVRRGEAVGPRLPEESLADWLTRAHEGRQRTALLGSSRADDIADPIGGPSHAYEAAAALIDEMVGRLIDLCWLRADSMLREA
jgi:protein-tyrosine phosphatase